ncbi:hypothetical protein ONZ45_g16606 [Pleurotus djamor]|nr:hypothetical protein ONZ45_g16606 [Pleurotus djamor]
MGQYFQFVNVDRRESTHMVGKIGEGSVDAPYDNGLCFALEARYKPTYELFLQKDTARIFRSRAARKGDLGALEKLPAELILMISSHMKIIPSIAFGIANSQVLAITYPSISNQMMEFWFDSLLWSHCRIIYLGDYAEGLPDGYLSEKEKVELAANFPGVAAGNLYDMASKFKYDGLGRPSLLVESRLRKALSSKEYLQYERLYNLPTPPKDWDVLINTTKKEFIKPSVEGVDLQTMIMPLIIWAGEDTKHLGIDNHGPWAGDRLAIVSGDDFDARVLAAGPDVWVDVVDKGLELQNQWIKALGARDTEMSLSP